MFQFNTVVGVGPTGNGYGGAVCIAGGTATLTGTHVGGDSSASGSGGNTALGGYNPSQDTYTLSPNAGGYAGKGMA